MIPTIVEEVALSLVPGEHDALLHQLALQLAVLRQGAVEEAHTGLVCDGAGTLEELFTVAAQFVWKPENLIFTLFCLSCPANVSQMRNMI